MVTFCCRVKCDITKDHERWQKQIKVGRLFGWLLNMIKVALSTALLGVVTVILEYFMDILTS